MSDSEEMVEDGQIENQAANLGSCDVDPRVKVEGDALKAPEKLLIGQVISVFRSSDDKPGL